MAAHTKRTSIHVERLLPSDLCVVTYDQSLLRDCLQPLVVNALQNTTHGSVTITYSAPPDLSAIIFDIRDTGRGISLDDQQRIFGHYEKLDLDAAGPGLGLTLARKAAETVNGTISLEQSERDRGSHFRIVLPGSYACRRPQQAALHASTVITLPKQYYIVQPPSTSATATSLSHTLDAAGFERACSIEHAVAIVPYTDQLDEYQACLSLAKTAPIACSLVPHHAYLSDLPEQHPSILFFRCPFTSSRACEILSQLNTAFEQRVTGCTMSEQALLHKSEKTAASSLGLAGLSTNLMCLLVDDNVINLRILVMYCQQRQFSHLKAINGLQAIDQYKSAAKTVPVRLILLDLQMPKCDGIEACTAIRSFEVDNGLPPAVVIIVTGQDNPHDRQSARQAGANEYFVKPLSMQALDKAVAQYFHAAQQ